MCGAVGRLVGGVVELSELVKDRGACLGSLCWMMTLVGKSS